MASGAEALLLYTTQKTVGGIYLQAKHHYYVGKDLQQVIGVTYDGSDIYWTDISAKQESIVRAREDGSKREVRFVFNFKLLSYFYFSFFSTILR
jgi:hypothetical protein